VTEKLETATVGLVSDTHGRMHPKVLQQLESAGCQAILHAGDICCHETIAALSNLAPVTAVGGNMDRNPQLPATEMLDIANLTFYILHDLGRLDLDPKAAGIDIVVFGHTHRPESFIRQGVLYINPGSAGPRRGRLPVSMALLEINQRQALPRFIDLD